VGGYIKIALGELRWGGVDEIGLVHDREMFRAPVNAVMTSGSVKGWEALESLHDQ
jgi:hypothetical protein